MKISKLARRVAILAAATTSLTSVNASAETRTDFPKEFRVQDIKTNGTTIHVRVGGAGPGSEGRA